MRHATLILLLLLVLILLVSCDERNTNPKVLRAPTFNPPGGTYTPGQSISITSATPNVVIRFTKDGSMPDSTSELYTGAMSIPGIFPIGLNSGTLRARAFKTGYAPSAVSSAEYHVNFNTTVADPTFSPASGSIPLGSSVTIATTTADADIYYTLDGSTPTITSYLYSAPIHFNTAGSFTLKAIAYKFYSNPSQVMTTNYQVTSGGK